MGREAERVERLIAAGCASYRLALRLYPDGFRRAYADELEADFAEASHDGYRASGRAGVLAAWSNAWRDLPGSLVREWCRTPWPAVAIAAAAIAGVVVLVSVVRAQIPLQRYRARVASNVPPPPDSPELLFLLVVMVLVPVISILVVTAVTALASRRHHRTARSARRHV